MGFEPGDIVAGGQTLIWNDGADPIEITVFKVRKFWQENLSFDDDEIPRVWDTVAEVEAAGLSIVYGEDDEAPGAIPIANALAFVKLNPGTPDEANVFNLEGPDGNRYAMLLWTLRKKGYKNCMSKFTGALRGRLPEGLHTGTFILDGKEETFKKRTYWVWKLAHGETNPDNLIQFFIEEAEGVAV